MNKTEKMLKYRDMILSSMKFGCQDRFSKDAYVVNLWPPYPATPPAAFASPKLDGPPRLVESAIFVSGS